MSSSYSKQAQRAHKVLNTLGIPLEIEGVSLELVSRIAIALNAAKAAGEAGNDADN